MSATDPRFVAYVDGVGARVDGNAVKVLLALIVIEAESGAAPGGAFQATIARIEALAELSRQTVMAARDALIEAGVIGRPDAVPGVTGSMMCLPVQNLDLPKGRYHLPFKSAQAAEKPSAEKPSTARANARGERASPFRKVQNLAFEREARERRRELVREALGILGTGGSAEFVGKCMEYAAKRMKAGASADELLEVVHAQRAAWDSGDRWAGRHNLIHLWSLRQFSALLGAARSGGWSRGQRGGLALPGGSEEWRRARDEDVARRFGPGAPNYRDRRKLDT